MTRKRSNSHRGRWLQIGKCDDHVASFGVDAELRIDARSSATVTKEPIFDDKAITVMRTGKLFRGRLLEQLLRK